MRDASRVCYSRGGTLVATHLTSVADEFGLVSEMTSASRMSLALRFFNPEPIEYPDLYLQPDGSCIDSTGPAGDAYPRH